MTLKSNRGTICFLLDCTPVIIFLCVFYIYSLCWSLLFIAAIHYGYYAAPNLRKPALLHYLHSLPMARLYRHFRKCSAPVVFAPEVGTPSLCQLFSTFFAEYIVFIIGQFSWRKVSHIFHQSQYWHIHLVVSIHINAFFSIGKCHTLRCRHYYCTRNSQCLQQC